MITTKCKLTFGLLQYLTDDRVAAPLEFSTQTDWIDLVASNGEIQIPDFYGNSPAFRVHQALGFNELTDLEQWLEKQYLSEIKPESLKRQTQYYSTLLSNKKKYEACCPEYIQQAEIFLASDKASLNKLEKLGLELYYSNLTLDIQAQLKNGQVIHQVIIEN